MTKQEFIATAYPAAKSVEKQTGIPALFVVAQSALETGWGRSAPGNMFFGVKAGKSWQGKKQLLRTVEYVTPDRLKNFPAVLETTPASGGKVRAVVKDYFRAYDDPRESFRDHANLLTTAERYKPALAYKSQPYKFGEAIARAGYATDPSYWPKIKSIMDEISGKAVQAYKAVTQPAQTLQSFMPGKPANPAAAQGGILLGALFVANLLLWTGIINKKKNKA